MFKRGIFLGSLLFIGAIGGMISLNYNAPVPTNIIIFIIIYIFGLLVGIIQILLSLNYRNRKNRKRLYWCFILELIYYVVATLFLIIAEERIGIKIFGMTAGLALIMIIVFSLKDLRQEK